MPSARVILEPYSNKVLNVIKAKYELKDKSAALNKFIDLYGDAEVEHEVKEEVIKKVIESCDRHIKKYGFKSMTEKDLDNLFESD